MTSYKYYKRYCKDIEKVENYEKAKADNFKNWQLHHRRETHNSDGERRVIDITAAELDALDMYYNRPAEELVFMTTKEHRQLHMKDKTNPMYGKHHSEETKNKISEAHKGITPWNKGKHVTEEHKKKIGEAQKGKKHTEEHKNKISEAQIGRHWYNNGRECRFCYECPDGFVPGRLR